ncbi:fibronectin-binding protein [Staphylococcus microti]|uniref:Fibronectin-binding protein n=1 Tax=Staphylococcus microti TaxID=569857 RepID=A0A0D6XSE5_9STAP|nr:elongation factor G-binding protein [Staphylococcus microti]KIX91744.1 fibronectin-binding protein [Staphylococcus microti]PNZ77067.1 elongation factor G-binding protein [Staphylococcus microti]SUM58304.1 fusidic acid resistance [Staphylococcus microti]
MKPVIYPYQYNDICAHVQRLKNVYKSVNDMDTIRIVQVDTRDAIIHTFNETEPELIELIDRLMNIRLSQWQVDDILLKLRNYVIPFELPSHKRMEKTFRKVKKIKFPAIEEDRLYTHSFIGWNDLASNRKYMMYYDEHAQLQGLYGDLSHQVVKGFCSICQKESNVALFMKKTNSASDGRYTKKGDYICHDSVRCNEQLTDIADFHAFINKLSR